MTRERCPKCVGFLYPKRDGKSGFTIKRCFVCGYFESNSEGYFLNPALEQSLFRDYFPTRQGWKASPIVGQTFTSPEHWTEPSPDRQSFKYGQLAQQGQQDTPCHHSRTQSRLSLRGEPGKSKSPRLRTESSRQWRAYWPEWHPRSRHSSSPKTRSRNSAGLRPAGGSSSRCGARDGFRPQGRFQRRTRR